MISITSLAAKALAFSLCAAIATSPSAFAETTAASVSTKKMEWRTDLAAALADAAKTDQAVLLRFTANWCGPCLVMDARVWPDQAVQAALAKNFIIVKSDVDEEASQVLAQKYGIRGVPTLLLLDSKGTEITRAGFMSSTEMVKFLDTSGVAKLQP